VVRARMRIKYLGTRSPGFSNRCCTEEFVVPGLSAAGLLEIPFAYKKM
jgi:hypothetical protein